MKSVVRRSRTVQLACLLLLALLAVGSSAQDSESPARVTAGLQVLYLFDEGTGTLVRDLSGVAPPLDLTIVDAAAVTWQAGALVLTQPTLLRAEGELSRLYDALRASNALTLEVWIITGDSVQGGPARILTFSQDTTNRNFTLGQDEDIYIARLRTTTTDANGEPASFTPRDVVTPALTHLVFTRAADGVTRWFIDGQMLREGVVEGDFSNWGASYGLALGNEIAGERPWLGTFYLAAIYDRALTPEDVLQNYTAGADTTGGDTAGAQGSTETPLLQPSASPPPTFTPVPPTIEFLPTTTPVTQDLLALYSFGEGSGTVVRDVSGVGAPLDLVIARPENVTWGAGFLTLRAETAIYSVQPAEKVVNAVRRRGGALSVELWITPAATASSAPAHVITLAQHRFANDFTVRQLAAAPDALVYDAHVRTTLTSLYGTPSLSIPGTVDAGGLTHLVLARDAAGTLRWYVNGVEVASYVAAGDFANWDASYHLALASQFASERYWLGTYHLVAIYGRALSAQDVALRYLAGTGDGAETPISSALPVTIPQDDANQPPQAVITVVALENRAEGTAMLQVDGSGSTDPDGTIREYYWSLPDSDDLLARGSAAALPLRPGENTFELLVVDDAALWATAQITARWDAP